MHTRGVGNDRGWWLVAVVLMVSSPAVAQGGLTGTFSGSFKGFDSFGQAEVQLDLILQCSLTCPPSAPELRYAGAGVDASFQSNPTESPGYISAFFGSNQMGQNSMTTTNFGAGVALTVEATSMNCYCGNRAVQSNYLTLTTPLIVVPPSIIWDNTVTELKAGASQFVIVSGQPRGSESIDVRITGPGIDITETLPAVAADKDAVKSWEVKPTSVGTITMTATLQPYGVGHTRTLPVVAGTASGSTGGGSGAGTGGGTGSGGDEAPAGCSTAPGAALAFALLALTRRARR